MNKTLAFLSITIFIAANISGCQTKNSGACLSDSKIAELTEKAERGDKQAASLIESHYMYCDEDDKKTRLWTEKLAALGDAEAYYRLYSDDNNSSDLQTKNKAISYLIKSAEGRYGFAQTILADKYFTGDGFTKNADEGELWLRRVVKTEDVEAMRNLSILVLMKTKSKESIMEAYMLSRKAQRLAAESSELSKRARRQAETVMQLALKSGISEKSLEMALKELPPQKEPAPTQNFPDLNELRIAAASCNTYAMADLVPILLVADLDSKSLAEALAWSKIVVQEAPRSYMATDAKRYMEFISIGANTMKLSEGSLQKESIKFQSTLNCGKGR